MRLLVTGSNGLVGSRVCARAEAAGLEVVGVGRGPRRTGGAYRYLELDLTGEAAVLSALEDARPDVVLHTASMTEVDACERDPEAAFAANATAAAAVARGARRVGAHVVHVSTDYVFDGEAGPYDEEALPNPRGVYALTKHLGEQAVKALAPSWAIARTAVVFGWPAAGRPNFGSWLVGALGRGEQVRLFTDQQVSPSLADSVAEMLLELSVRKLPGVWHTSGGEVVDRYAFGQRLCEVFGFDPALLRPVRMAELALPSPRPLRSGLLTGKVARQLSAQPLALQEALLRFHASYQGR